MIARLGVSLALAVLSIDVVFSGKNILHYGFDRAEIYSEFNMVTKVFVKYAFIFYFLSGVVDLRQKIKTNFFFFVLLIILTGNKFSGLINFVFWYFLAVILYGDGLTRLSCMQIMLRYKVKFLLTLSGLLTVIVFALLSIENISLVKFLIARVLQFQGQLWWYFYNYPVDPVVGQTHLVAEVMNFINNQTSLETGISYMMSFILPLDTLENMKERGYLYTFGYPTIYLALSIPILGAFGAFFLSTLILALYNEIRHVSTIGDFLYLLILLVVLAPLLNFAKVGSISGLLTLPFFLKLGMFIILKLSKHIKYKKNERSI